MISLEAATMVDVDAPLMAVGFDSLTAAEFSGNFNSHFSTTAPTTLLFDHPTARAIASILEVT